MHVSFNRWRICHVRCITILNGYTPYMTDSNTNSNEIFELPLKSESPSYRLRTIDEVVLSF